MQKTNSFLFSLIAISLSFVLFQCQSTNTSEGSTGSSFKNLSSTVLTDSVFTEGIEGPAYGPDGFLYLVNYRKKGTIGKMDMDGNCTLFSKLINGRIANGIRFDLHHNMYMADYVGHNILWLPKGETTIRVFAHSDSMNQPNDLAIMDIGILFASDPNWAEETGQLWRIMPSGKIELMEKDMGTTNGVEVSPDNKSLYVNESVQAKLWHYDLSSAGELSNKKLFYDFKEGGMDGMRTDKEGNLYVTRYGEQKIIILSPEGELLGEIKLQGKKPSNVAFGGKDGKTLFITLQDKKWVETCKVPIAGRYF